jgi:gluconate 2-dehydrogenase gamma chain
VGQGSKGISRRGLLTGGAAIGAAGAAAAATVQHDGALGGPPQAIRGEVPWAEGAADAPVGASGTGYVYFTAAEQPMLEAMVDRLIPPDPTGPSASEAGVPFFIDRQLAGLYGQGQHFYLGGPWPQGTPQQGYQSRFNPAQLYRAALKAIADHVFKAYGGLTFQGLQPDAKDKLLKDLEAGQVELDGVDGKAFFTMLLQNTKEGYFSDPIYGGNKDMAAWKMIGFPGAHYDYREWVSRFNQRVPFTQVSFKGRPGWTER